MEKRSRRREASSMGANNNNNNSYGNNELNGLRQRRQQVVDVVQVEGQRGAAVEGAQVSAAGQERLSSDSRDNQIQAGHNSANDCGQPNQPPARQTLDLDFMVSGGSGRTALAMGSLVESKGRAQRRIHHGGHLSQLAGSSSRHQSSKASRFVVTILLPFLLVFLLPSSSDRRSPARGITDQLADHLDPQRLDRLLLSLLRLPLDRFRLSSGYSMMLLANAKELVHEPGAMMGRQLAANDLLEEETHMVAMAPEQQQQHHHHQRQPAGFQLGPVRSAAYGGGGGGGAGLATDQDSYGHDYGSGSSANHANLVGSGAAAEPNADGDPTTAAEVMPASASGSVVAPTGGGSAAAQRTDLPSVRALNVKCEKNHMTVNIVFDRPFYGMVFSKGHYNDQKCVHLPPNSGQTSINFDIHLGKCGMSSSSDPASAAATTNGQQQQALQQASGGQQPNGLFIENTIIIQYDPQVQEIYDQARRLRCTWYDYYEKSVTFRPYNVDMLDAVTANFLGDNIQCWMQIQVGKGPWSSEVAGIVKIGQTMTMVLAIKDDENKFDMLVRNCVASDGKHQPIQLVDEYGCVARPKIMAKFQKVRNFGPAATVVSYAHFQAFKFPDSMSVHFQCVIQVCRYECPEPVCSGTAATPPDSIGSAPQSAGGLTGPQQAADYAASGTELVSSKEALPMPSSSSSSSRAQNLSHLLQGSSSGINSVNLKLDESQGRVQVKLDTSMMANAAAGGQGGLRASSGPLPPHLLHSSQQQPTTTTTAGSHTYLSSSYYRPSLGGATGPSMSTNGRPSAAAASHLRTNSAPIALPSGGQHQQYSNPAASSLLSAHHYPRPAYMMSQRMGELVAEDGPIGGASGGDDDLTRLSMIASPRALPYAMPTLSTSNHRYRRSINATAGEILKAKRQLASAPQPDSTSTAIKTQRTIQVVSPDDVAFSLIDLDGGGPSWQPESAGAEWNQQRARRPTKGQPYQSSIDDSATMVCFSAGRFLTSALASLALLVGLVLAAALIIMRQRKRLNEKLSPVYDSSMTASASSPESLMINSQALASHHLQQQHQQRTEQMILRRQREEMQRRNTYLGRLYSQFVPAAHWR